VAGAEQRGTLEVRVDRDACRGAGECVFRAPASFALDAEGKSVPSEPPADPEEVVLAAARSCPHFAIAVRRGGRALV